LKTRGRSGRTLLSRAEPECGPRGRVGVAGGRQFEIAYVDAESSARRHSPCRAPSQCTAAQRNSSAARSTSTAGDGSPGRISTTSPH